MNFIPYLVFTGNCRQAMDFYADALKGKIIYTMEYKDMPPSDDLPPTPDDYMDKILHGTMDIGGERLYFSDTFPSAPITTGNNLEININCSSEAELREIFAKLSIDGKVTMPVAEQFWGSIFASVTDKYGFGWSLNYDLPEE